MHPSLHHGVEQPKAFELLYQVSLNHLMISQVFNFVECLRSDVTRLFLRLIASKRFHCLNSDLYFDILHLLTCQLHKSVIHWQQIILG